MGQCLSKKWKWYNLPIFIEKEPLTNEQLCQRTIFWQIKLPTFSVEKQESKQVDEIVNYFLVWKIKSNKIIKRTRTKLSQSRHLVTNFSPVDVCGLKKWQEKKTKLSAQNKRVQSFSHCGLLISPNGLHSHAPSTSM